jgi:RNA polymerase sigma-70 factor (ECF subfamily)
VADRTLRKNFFSNYSQVKQETTKDCSGWRQYIDGRANPSGRGAVMDHADRVWREQGLRSAVLAGDERAWRTWYDEAFPGLYAYVSWRCAGLRDRTEDVVQETWLIAVRRLRQFNPASGSFSAWLRGIAANVLRNQFRKGRRPMQSLNGEPVAPDLASKREQAERIVQALAGLPQRYEAVLRAKYLEQQSVAQIADSWKETPKTIESLLTRARLAFREAYQQLE